jgi:mRNA interferase RelE/StbE
MVEWAWQERSRKVVPSPLPGMDPPFAFPGLRIGQPEQVGYHIARMRHEIVLAPSAAKDLRRLKANVRAAVREAIERHLRHEPGKVSKSPIKRLRGLAHPQYRLRVEDVRVFYDVREVTVEVLAIVPKSEAEAWLAEAGESEEPEEESDEESAPV